jgi:transposase
MVTPRPLRIMFEDEARFGRLMEPRACWAPYPIRPIIPQGVVREYVYAYTAASPLDGRIDFTIQPFLDSDNVNQFLKYLSAWHSNEEVILVWDGARAHTADEVKVPSNIHPILLPPRSPRLNPVESFWGELREKFFHNFTFESIPLLMDYLVISLCMIKNDKWKLKKLLGFNWINKIILKAI